jgi:hypothetical protein
MRRLTAAKRLALATAVAAASAIGLPLASMETIGGSMAAAQGSTEQAELAKEMAAARVSLAQGLKASQSEGTPISAKYELEEGQLQLSVYTEKAGKFAEVIIDHTTGAVAKTEAITHGDDLLHAKAQSDAMAKARRPLEAAVSDVENANTGFKAVSVTPALKDGHPVADVNLVMGTAWKTLSQKLD